MLYQEIFYNLDKVFVGKSLRVSSNPDNKQKELVYEITKRYPILKDDFKIRCYIIKNGILIDSLLCKNCKVNYVKFNSPSKGFATYCSPKCANTSDEFIESSKKTCMLKYGHEFSFASQVIKNKKTSTLIKKFDTLNSEFLTDKNFIIKNFIINDFFNAKEFMLYFNCSQGTAYKTINDLKINYKKRRGNSEAEFEIMKFIEESTIQGDRSLGIELDILSNDFAIEYNGLMFHSFGISKYTMFNNYELESKNKNKHLLKTKIVESNNLQLFHIFENEWNNKKEIWKSVINSKMGRTTKIFARKCIIKEVDSKTSKWFLDNNHLQGNRYSKINYGLYYNDELVSLMTFGSPNNSKSFEYELIRFCSKLNYTIVGGASKLLKHFEKIIKPKSLVTYANKRWSLGNLYKTIGFTFSHESNPNYFYFKEDDDILFSRNKFQKHKLSKLLENFDNNLTETINMYNNNYRKIYDSGNLVFYKEYIK
jgi:hypothetical protein